MQRSLLRRAAAAFILGGLVSAASADCRFSPVQDVDVHASHWNDVLLFDQATSSFTAAGPVFGTRSASFTPTPNQWFGAFVYDYILQQYVQGLFLQVSPPPGPPH